jgi:signal transduction histidine kinase
MKRTWMTWPIVGGVILLLTVLIALQYGWQASAAAAEREIMQRRVEADTRRFADDLNREIQGAYVNFQMDSDSWERSDWTEFNERYEFWRSRTEFPHIIKDIYYWQPKSDSGLRYDPAAKTFSSTPLPENLAGLRSHVSAAETFKPFYPEQFTLALPVHSAFHSFERIRVAPGVQREPQILEMPSRHGYILIQLDREVVLDRIVPGLAAQYFPNGDFKLDIIDANGVSVYRSAGEVLRNDASEKLLTFSPENMILFSNKMALPRHSAKESSIVVDQHIESRTLIAPSPEASSGKTFTLQLNSDGKQKKTAVFTARQPEDIGWTLGVQHASGSVDAFISGERNKKLAAGFAVYLLVIGSILAIAFSAMRSQRFAQRQIDFVSSVSHEFRTPLAVIYSAGENLADGVANDKAQVEKYGSVIKGEGRKLSSMVEQILEFAGARSGKRKFNFTHTDLNEVVDLSLSECGQDLTEGEFTVEKELGARVPSISADPDALRSAVQNLIRNAVKYSNGERWIRVSTSFENGNAAVRVEDRGIGVAQSELSKIFDPFYRSKEVVDEQIHGNGLGLSLVKEIVEAHGGTVSAKSQKGKGSTFTIEIPAAM